MQQKMAVDRLRLVVMDVYWVSGRGSGTSGDDRGRDTVDPRRAGVPGRHNHTIAGECRYECLNIHISGSADAADTGG